MIGGGKTWGGTWWRERLRRTRSAALAALPTDRAEAAFEAGRVMRRQQALALALGGNGARPGEGAGTAKLLSKRERDVAELVVEGLTNRQIAARIHVSVRTVETHIRHIRTSLGLRSRAHIAAWVAHRQAADLQAPNPS
ncbi:response regulator transcription factor [Streptomyces milbemycinicus]